MNSVRKHTLYMLVIGGLIWVGFIIYVQFMLTYSSLHHLEIELAGIPVSWGLSYVINSLVNFRQRLSFQRFLSSIVISIIGWSIFILASWIFIDIIGLKVIVGNFIGIGITTVTNLIGQQAVTFMWLGEKERVHEPQSIKASYDWDAYFNGNFVQKWWKAAIVAHVVELVKDDNPLIDLGCGSSPMLSMMRGRDKLGIEIDAFKVDFMNKIDSRNKYKVGDATATGISANSFTAVVSTEVLEHLDQPELLVAEAARLCTPGGKVILATPDFSTPLWNIVEVLYGLLMPKAYHGEHNTKFTESSLKALAAAYKLRHIETRRVFFGADLVMLFRKER